MKPCNECDWQPIKALAVVEKRKLSWCKRCGSIRLDYYNDGKCVSSEIQRPSYTEEEHDNG